MQLFDQALDAQRNGKFQEAELLYRRILANDSRNFDALHMLGIVCAETAKFSEAEEIFRAALSIDPKYPPCYHNFGLFFVKLKRYQEAINSLTERWLLF